MVIALGNAIIVADDHYLRWLADLYSHHFDVVLEDRGELVEDAKLVISKHCRPWTSVEDFVPLVATEMAERLASDRLSPLPFQKLIDLCADTVRHRIERAGRVQRLLMKNSRVEQPQTQEFELTHLQKELREGLTLEEKTVLDLLLDGKPISETARLLNVSKRTLYRRLERIRDQLSH
jgi:hypothetical protein